MAHPLASTAPRRVLPREAEARAAQAVPAHRRARAALRVQPRVRRLREDPVPHRDPPARVSVEDAVAAIEECGAPMVSIAGGEPLLHPRHRRDGAGARRPEAVRVPLHQRGAPAAQARPLPAVALLLLGRPHRRPARAPRRVGLPTTGCSTRRSSAIREAKEQGFRVTTNSTFFNTDSPSTVREVLDFLNDDLAGRRDDDLAGLRVREGARPGALPGGRADAARCSATRSPTAAGDAGGSTTSPCSSTSSRARWSTTARRGRSRATRCSVGNAPAT